MLLRTGSGYPRDTQRCWKDVICPPPSHPLSQRSEERWWDPWLLQWSASTNLIRSKEQLQQYFSLSSATATHQRLTRRIKAAEIIMECGRKFIKWSLKFRRRLKKLDNAVLDFEFTQTYQSPRVASSRGFYVKLLQGTLRTYIDDGLGHLESPLTYCISFEFPIQTTDQAGSLPRKQR